LQAAPVIWGNSNASGTLNATAIPTTTAPAGVFFSNASSDFGVKIVTSNLSQDGMGAGDGSVAGPTWWFEGGTRSNLNQSINYSAVSFGFTSTTNQNSATAVTGVHFVLEDAEVEERFRNFVYYDTTGAAVAVPYYSSIFTFSSGKPGVHASDGSFDSGSASLGGTQPGKTIDVNFGSLPITGFGFQTGRSLSNYGSVEMSGLGNIVPFTFTNAAGGVPVADNASYSLLGLGTIATTGHGTVAQLLDGTSSGDKTVTMKFNSGTPQFQTNFTTGDTLSLMGTNNEIVVLQLTYDPSTLPAGTNERDLFLSWIDPSDNSLLNAIDENSDHTEDQQIFGAYDPNQDFHLGYYGVDVESHTVWAVIDHNSNFTVAAAPEPTSAALALCGALPLLMRRRRR